jgi:hypothetical protein
MKNLIKLILLIILVTVLWRLSGYRSYNRENYFSNKALELSTPFDVKIDTEFLKSLRPAK